MANVTISALPTATTLGSGDVVPVVQGGVTKKAPYTLFTGGGGSSSPTAVVLTTTNDGSADVTAAINAAAQAAVTAGLPLFIPKGNYKAEGGITIPANLTVRGVGETSRIYGSRSFSYVMQVQGGVVLQDLMVENTFSDGCICVDVAGGSVNVKFHRVRFKGIHGQAVNVNAAGVSDVSIDACRFVDVGYGILTNDGANDLTNFRVTNSTFLNVYADAIEFNHPANGEPATAGFIVQGCTIQVPNGAGSGSTGGFGVGAAGVGDLRIIGNTFLPSRREAIHIEDTSRRVVIDGNTIAGISGADASAGIAIYADVQSCVITNNTLKNVSKTGIIIIYDTNPNGDYDVIIAHNVIDTTVEHGISIAGEFPKGDRFIVSHNIIRNCGYDGIDILGMHRESMITNNIIDNCARWGILAADPSGVPPRLRMLRENIITNCTNGDYAAQSIATGNAIVLHDRNAFLNPTAASSSATLNVPLFRVGEYANGKVVVQGRRTDANGTRADALFDITWNGTALIAKPLLSKTNVGTTSFTNLAVINGVLNAVTAVGGTGVTLEVSAQFSGLILETNETYTGTVTGTAS
jgi:hypothetical protein